MTFLMMNNTFDQKRENIVETGMQEVINQVTELQTLLLMSDVYGENMTCIIMNEKLEQLDSSIWTLGLKIDDYRQATEEFQKSPYYKTQKKLFIIQDTTMRLGKAFGFARLMAASSGCRLKLTSPIISVFRKAETAALIVPWAWPRFSTMC